MHILRPHFEAFVLILPDDGGINVQQLRRELAARAREQSLGFLRRVFIGVIVIARAAALMVVPMRDRVDWLILLRPQIEFGADVGGNFVEGHEGFAAMLADQAGLAHVAREQGQKWRPAARRFRISRRRGGQALEPDLPVVRNLRREPVRAHERMREPPRPAFELAERLRQPAPEREVVPALKCPAIFLPQRVER